MSNALETLELEIAEVHREHDSLDDRLFAVQEQYDVAWAETPLDEDSHERLEIPAEGLLQTPDAQYVASN